MKVTPKHLDLRPNSTITYYHSYSFPSPSSYYTLPPSPSNLLPHQQGSAPSAPGVSYCCCTQCCACSLQLVARNSAATPLYHPVAPYVHPHPHPSLTSISIVNRYSAAAATRYHPAVTDSEAVTGIPQIPPTVIFQNGLLNRPVYHEELLPTANVLLDDKRCPVDNLQLVVVDPTSPPDHTTSDMVSRIPRLMCLSRLQNIIHYQCSRSHSKV